MSSEANPRHIPSRYRPIVFLDLDVEVKTGANEGQDDVETERILLAPRLSTPSAVPADSCCLPSENLLSSDSEDAATAAGSLVPTGNRSQPTATGEDEEPVESGTARPPLSISDLLTALQRAQSRARAAEDAVRHVAGLLQKVVSDSAEAESAANGSIAHIAAMLQPSSLSPVMLDSGFRDALSSPTQNGGQRSQHRETLIQTTGPEPSAYNGPEHPLPMYQSRLLHSSSIVGQTQPKEMMSTSSETQKLKLWLKRLKHQRSAAAVTRHIAEGLSLELFDRFSATVLDHRRLSQSLTASAGTDPAGKAVDLPSLQAPGESVTEGRERRGNKVKDAGWEGDRKNEVMSAHKRSWRSSEWGEGGSSERESELESALWRTTMELRRCERELAVYRQQRLLADRKSRFVPSSTLKSSKAQGRGFTERRSLKTAPRKPQAVGGFEKELDKGFCSRGSLLLPAPAKTGNMLLLLLCSLRDFLNWALRDQEVEGSGLGSPHPSQCHISIIVELVMAAHVA